MRLLLQERCSFKMTLKERRLMLKRYSIVLVILLLTAANLSACGQKGPLYLPLDTDQAASR